LEALSKNGASRAPVGQAFIHRSQEPHWFAMGLVVDTGKVAVVRISARKTYEPNPGIMSELFFPINPMPEA